MTNINQVMYDPNIRKITAKKGKKYSEGYKKKIKSDLKFNKTYKKLRRILVDVTTSALKIDETFVKKGRPQKHDILAKISKEISFRY